ncbi:phage terminase small subunit [Streptomyces brevispora]
MATGGRRGPKPSPHAPHSRHRNDEGAEWTYLPPEGCTDPVPDLPRGREWSEAEREHWTALWTAPIAVVYEDAMSGLVAAYVIAVSATLTGSRISAQLVGETRQLANDLMLTPGAMARGRYKVGEQPTTGHVAAVHSLRVGA